MLFQALLICTYDIIELTCLGHCVE